MLNILDLSPKTPCFFISTSLDSLCPVTIAPIEQQQHNLTQPDLSTPSSSSSSFIVHRHHRSPPNPRKLGARGTPRVGEKGGRRKGRRTGARRRTSGGCGGARRGGEGREGSISLFWLVVGAWATKHLLRRRSKAERTSSVTRASIGARVHLLFTSFSSLDSVCRARTAALALFASAGLAGELASRTVSTAASRHDGGSF